MKCFRSSNNDLTSWRRSYSLTTVSGDESWRVVVSIEKQWFPAIEAREVGKQREYRGQWLLDHSSSSEGKLTKLPKEDLVLQFNGLEEGYVPEEVVEEEKPPAHPVLHVASEDPQEEHVAQEEEDVRVGEEVEEERGTCVAGRVHEHVHDDEGRRDRREAPEPQVRSHGYHARRSSLVLFFRFISVVSRITASFGIILPPEQGRTGKSEVLKAIRGLIEEHLRLHPKGRPQAGILTSYIP